MFRSLSPLLTMLAITVACPAVAQDEQSTEDATGDLESPPGDGSELQSNPSDDVDDESDDTSDDEGPIPAGTFRGLLWAIKRAKPRIGVKFEDGAPPDLKRGTSVVIVIAGDESELRGVVMSNKNDTVKVSIKKGTIPAMLKPKSIVTIRLAKPQAADAQQEEATEVAGASGTVKPLLTPAQAPSVFETDGFRFDVSYVSATISESIAIGDNESSSKTASTGTTIRPSWGFGKGAGGIALELTMIDSKVEDDEGTSTTGGMRLAPTLGIGIQGLAAALTYDNVAATYKDSTSTGLIALSRITVALGYATNESIYLLTYKPKAKIALKFAVDELDEDISAETEVASEVGASVRHHLWPGKRLVIDAAYDLADETNDETEAPKFAELMHLLVGADLKLSPVWRMWT